MRLTIRCYAATGLGYSAPWCVNAGVIVGDRITLVVDTGGNALAAQTIFGYATAVRPENTIRVINTEKHFDHIGGNGFFRQQGVDVWGHAEILRTADEFAAEIAEFNEGIPNPVRRALGEARAFFTQTGITNPNCPIAADTRFHLGEVTAEILLTPGHTPTNLCVWLPQEGVLYSGDCLINEYLPNLDAGTVADWHIWLKSLDRLEALKPAILVPGHGPVAQGKDVSRIFGEVRKVLREAIACRVSPTSK